MKKLNKILQKIREGKILNSATFQNLDFEDALDQRDSSDFENEWLEIFNEIGVLLRDRPLNEDELNLINIIREVSYKKVYEHTEYPEMCAYVSDDFEIISKAFILSYNDDWLNALWNGYNLGVFPCGKLNKKVRKA